MISEGYNCFGMKAYNIRNKQHNIQFAVQQELLTNLFHYYNTYITLNNRGSYFYTVYMCQLQEYC